MKKCGNGHKSKASMWECPVCVKELDQENASLRQRLDRARELIEGAEYSLGEGAFLTVGNAITMALEELEEGEK